MPMCVMISVYTAMVWPDRHLKAEELCSVPSAAVLYLSICLYILRERERVIRKGGRKEVFLCY